MNFSPIFLLALPYALSAMDTPPQDPTNDQPWVSAKSLGGDTYLAVKRIETTPVHEIPELKNKIPKSALFNALKQLIKFPFTLEEWEMLDACNITERVIEIKDRTPKMKKVREQIGWFPTILEEPAIWPRGCFKHQKYTQCTCTDEKHTEETPTLPNTISYWIAPQESPCAYSHNKSNSDRAELIPQVHPANHPEILTIRIVKHHQQNHLPLLEQHIVTIQNPKESHQYANFEVTSNIDSKNNKNSVIHIAVEVDNESQCLDKRDNPVHALKMHFISEGTSSNNSAIPYLLEKVETKIQKSNQHDLYLAYANEEQTQRKTSKILLEQIQSRAAVEEIIKKQKQSFCSIQ